MNVNTCRSIDWKVHVFLPPSEPGHLPVDFHIIRLDPNPIAGMAAYLFIIKRKFPVSWHQDTLNRSLPI